MADEGRDGGGDLVVELVQERHRHFQRAGDHLLLAVHLPLVDALSGCHVPVMCIDPEAKKKKKRLAISTLSSSGRRTGSVDTVKPGQVWVLRNEGMPSESDPSRRGHLYVRVFIDFPDRIPQTPPSSSPQQSVDGEEPLPLSAKIELERILGQRSKAEDPEDDGRTKKGSGFFGGIFGGGKKQGASWNGKSTGVIFAERAPADEVRQLDEIWGSQQ